MNLKSRRTQLIVAAAVVGIVLVAVFVLPKIRTRPPDYPGGHQEDRAENPWPQVVSQLRKESDVASCRRVLGQLDAELARVKDPGVPRPAGLTDEQERAVRSALGLTEEEAKEVRPASYSNLDPHYLAECLYLRDAARTLAPAGTPPARQAELAFAWVCRQVVLHPWVVQPAGSAAVTLPPVPPTAVLRRGSGSGLERAYVFLALLQQLGLDGCLIGPPEAASRGWAYRPDASGGGPPRGPFWAVGARVGPDVLLFDPWRGEPAPGPGGKGVGTLARAKADPGQLKAWGVDAEAVKAAVPFLAVPLSAVAPRMRILEDELKADQPVRLAVDPVAVRDRFAAETKSAASAFWNPPGDSFGYTRVLASFTPREEGGWAATRELEGQYRLSLLPPAVFALPPELQSQEEGDAIEEAAQRVRTAAISAFGGAFLADPSAREQLQRGQFNEVAPALTQKRTAFAAAQQRLRTDQNREAQIRLWAETARKVYAKLGRARSQEKPDPAAVGEAQLEVEKFWKDTFQVFSALVDLAVADAGMAEATYLLALCKHEQAEQAQARSEQLAADPRQKNAAGKARERAADAWREAANLWGWYQPFAGSQDRAYPGRKAHARTLADRADRMAAGLGGR